MHPLRGDAALPARAVRRGHRVVLLLHRQRVVEFTRGAVRGDVDAVGVGGGGDSELPQIVPQAGDDAVRLAVACGELPDGEVNRLAGFDGGSELAHVALTQDERDGFRRARRRGAEDAGAAERGWPYSLRYGLPDAVAGGGACRGAAAGLA